MVTEPTLFIHNLTYFSPAHKQSVVVVFFLPKLAPNYPFYKVFVISLKTTISRSARQLSSALHLHQKDNIRILHGYEVRIENSVPKVTVWHHEALPINAKQCPEGRNFLSAPNTNV